MTVAPTHARHPLTGALLNLTGQLLLLAAIPFALWKLSGNPIPRRIPSWTEIQVQWHGIAAQPTQLAEPVLRVMADLLWIMWAWYALWTAIGLIWILLRLPRTILPGALSAITPAIAFRALSLGALATHPAAPVHTASTATAPAAPAPSHPAPTFAGTRAAGTAASVDVVEPGDNLWDLAQRYYQQGQDWHEIYDANQGIEQPDGRRLQNPNLIQPGWHLAIPAIPAPAAPDINGTAPAVHPVPAPPHGPTTARPTPNRVPGRPASAPAATAPHTPRARHPGGILAPAANRPHAVGHPLPRDAGYIGITLITSIAAAVTILRARNRHRGHPKNQGIPDLAAHIAAVHSLARSAQDYGFDPEDHPDMDVPPLYKPLDKQVNIATSPDGRTEIPFTPENQPGPLVLTGPGAQDAARAAAISTLAAKHTLKTDPELTTELLGTNTPAQPENHQPGITNIRSARRQPDGTPGPIILDGPDRADTASNTVVEVDRDGTVRHATGPEAVKYIGSRIHTLTAQAAATLHETLEDAQPGPPAAQSEPPTGSDTPAQAATDSEDQPNPDADLRTLTSIPVIVQVLGEVAVHGPATPEPTRVTAERPAALLTLLALHPDGASPRTLHEREWATAPDQHRARISLNTTLNRVRAPLRAALGDSVDEARLLHLDKATGKYQLNPQIVTSDIAIARDLTAQADAATDADVVRLLIQATTVYRAPLAPRIEDRDRDWLTTARYAILNETTALHLRVAELTAETRPDTAASHLVEAVALAPEDPRIVSTALRACYRLQRPDLGRSFYRRHSEALRALGEVPGLAIEKLAREDPRQERG